MGKFDEVELRLFEVTNKNKSKDIYELMGVSSSTYGNWRQRDSIPYEKIISLCENHNLDMRYILTGKKTEILINYEHENLKIIENLSKKEHEKLYYMLKSKFID